jgi:hypothetical protein
MPDDRFEETKLKITPHVTRGLFEGSKSVDIKFVQVGGDPKVDDKEVKVPRGGSAEHEIKFPKVKNTENHVSLNYSCEFEKTNIGQRDYNVWPKTLDIKATLDNTANAAVGFRFKINQRGNTSQVWTVARDGTCSPKLEFPADAAIIPISPWEFVGAVVNTDQPRKRDLNVRKKPWKAKIKNITEGKTAESPLKAWVNLAKDFATFKGNILKVEVGPEEMNLAEKDQEIKVRVTFPATNSKRNSPLTALQTGEDPATALAAKDGTAKPGEKALVYETVVKIPDDHRKAVFYVNLGVAGGDKCKIEVGVTDTYEDDVCHVENWRKIAIEMLVPEPAIRQNVTDTLASAGAALSADLKKELERTFDKTFVEFEFPTAGCLTFGQADLTYFNKGDGNGFTATQIASAGDMIIDADKLWLGTVDSKGKEKRQKLSKGKKIFLATWHQMEFVRWQKRGQNAMVPLAKNAMCLRWADRISKRARENVLYAPPTTHEFRQNLSAVENAFMTNMEKSSSKDVTLPFHVFDKDPICASGQIGVYAVKWRAHHYKKPSDADWTDVGATTPGSAYKDLPATWTMLADEAAMKKWVEIKDSRHVKVKLPKDDPGDPGNLQKIKVEETQPDGSKKNVEYLLDIQVLLVCKAVNFYTNGEALSGYAMYQSQAKTNGIAAVLSHEIGHNFGQGYTEKAVGEGGGIGTEIGGVTFGVKTPAGKYYVGKGHTGSHCAKHIVEYAEGKPNKNDILSIDKWTEPTPAVKDDFAKINEKLSSSCVMYGASDLDATYKLDFCDDCKRFIRATDLSDVTKDWTA